eukprot:gene7489-8915_t
MESDEDDDLFVVLDNDGRIYGTSEEVDFSFQTWKEFVKMDKSLVEELRRDCVLSSFPLTKSFWLSAEAASRMNLEKLARLIFDHHTKGVEFNPALSGMECVSHSDKLFRAEDAYGSIDFHFDKDEIIYTKHHLFVHPQLSTVTYLTDVGAPILVFDQRISSTASAPYTRVTFLVNIWLNHRPVDVPVFPDHLLAKVGNLDLPLSSKVADRVPQIEVCSKTEGGGDELSFTVCQSRDQEHTLRTRLPLKELAAKKLATAEIMYTV